MAAALGPDPPLGTRDTFPYQEQVRLRNLVRMAVAGELAEARAAFAAGERSVWRREAERDQLWRVAHRCLTFLETAAAIETRSVPPGLRTLVEAYTAADGLWRLDHDQRLYEQAAAICAQDDEIEPLVQAARAGYRAVLGPIQAAFQAAVQADGWPPPDGIRRQTQTFDRHVAPEIDERRKTAYFFVDSLRYEMGRDLAEALTDLGAATVDGVATVLPTTTPCGIAALLPGADGALTLVEHRDGLVPALGGVPLAGRAERREVLAARFGDRFFDVNMGDLLSMSRRQLASRIRVADLVVVHTQDIDAAGESLSLFQARKAMSEIIGDLPRAAERLAAGGFQTLVSPPITVTSSCRKSSPAT